MLIERVRTEPDPYEPFLLSQAIRAGDLLFVSGQAATTTAADPSRVASTPRPLRRSRTSSARYALVGRRWPTS
jgi:enamine deaminase RidA (YjgF/YER057c/UK114 family)